MNFKGILGLLSVILISLLGIGGIIILPAPPNA
jgi:hypothetical protein